MSMLAARILVVVRIIPNISSKGRPSALLVPKLLHPLPGKPRLETLTVHPICPPTFKSITQSQ